MFLWEVIVSIPVTGQEESRTGLNGEERKVKIMFTNISWADYLVVITLLLTVYYLVIGIRFYSHELRTFLSGWLKPGIGPLPTKTPFVPGTPLQAEWPENLDTPNHAGSHLDNTALEQDGISGDPPEIMAEAIRKAGRQAE